MIPKKKEERERCIYHFELFRLHYQWHYWRERVPVLIRAEFIANNLAHLMLKRIFHRLTSSLMHFSPVPPAQATYFWGWAQFPHWGRRPFIHTGVFILEAVPTPGRLARAMPTSDGKASKYTPRTPNYCQCTLNSTSLQLDSHDALATQHHQRGRKMRGGGLGGRGGSRCKETVLCGEDILLFTRFYKNIGPWGYIESLSRRRDWCKQRARKRSLYYVPGHCASVPRMFSSVYTSCLRGSHNHHVR